MRITLNELRTLIRSEVRKTLIENAIRNRTPEEIENYAAALRGRENFVNMTPLQWASHFREMGTMHKDTLFRKQVYRDLSDEDLIALADIMTHQIMRID
jgi:hypothetical protein